MVRKILSVVIPRFPDGTPFLADMKDFVAFNKIYEEYFVSKPARSCVAVKELPKGVLCEIEVIALIK